MNEDNVKIDCEAMLNRLVDNAFGRFALAVMPDEKTKDILSVYFKVHRKYGIDTITTMNIINDLFKELKDKGAL